MRLQLKMDAAASTRRSTGLALNARAQRVVSCPSTGSRAVADSRVAQHEVASRRKASRWPGSQRSAPTLRRQPRH